MLNSHHMSFSRMIADMRVWGQTNSRYTWMVSPSILIHFGGAKYLQNFRKTRTTLLNSACRWLWFHGRCRTTKSMWHVRPAMSPWTTFDWSSPNARPGADQGLEQESFSFRKYWRTVNFDSSFSTDSSWIAPVCCKFIESNLIAAIFLILFDYFLCGGGWGWEQLYLNTFSSNWRCGLNDSLPIWKKSMITTKQAARRRKWHTQIGLPTCHLTQEISSPLS